MEIDLQHPRHIDGEPHEVASAAGRDLSTILTAALKQADGFNWAARGAWMSAEEHRTGDMPDGSGWPDTPQGTRITKLYDDLREALGTARVLTNAAAWNPRGQLTTPLPEA